MPDSCVLISDYQAKLQECMMNCEASFAIRQGFSKPCLVTLNQRHPPSILYFSFQCSEHCARGTRIRSVNCVSADMPSDTLEESRCSGTVKPPRKEYCILKPCRVDFSKFFIREWCNFFIIYINCYSVNNVMS